MVKEIDINFSEVLTDLDNNPLIDFDGKKEYEITLGRIVGNVLANFRPEIKTQADMEKFDAIKAVDIALRIYKGGKVKLESSDLDFIIDYVSKVPFSKPIIEYRIKNILNNARVKAKA